MPSSEVPTAPPDCSHEPELQPTPESELEQEQATEPEPEPAAEPAPELEEESDEAPRADVNEALTEQTIGDLEEFDIFSDEDVPPLDVPLPGASERIAELIDQLGAAPEQKVESALDPLTEMKIEEIIPTEMQGQSTPTNAAGNTTAGQSSAEPDDQVENFFAKQNREIEMPPEKKKGFFARLRGE